MAPWWLHSGNDETSLEDEAPGAGDDAVATTAIPLAAEDFAQRSEAAEGDPADEDHDPEIDAGAEAPAPKRRRRRRRRKRRLAPQEPSVLDVTPAVARIWGRIQGEAERAGRTLPVVDSLIASTAFATVP